MTAGQEQGGEELAVLRQQLEDLQQAMAAIRGGDVDAVVVGGPQGEQLYTHVSADRPYRVIVEEMGDGAVTVSERGVILYGNDRMAKLLGRDRPGLLGSDVADLVAPASAGTLRHLMDAEPGVTRRAELHLRGSEDAPVPVLASVTGLDIDGLTVRCLIVADLTDERRAAAAVSDARQQLLRQQLELEEEHRLNRLLQQAVLPGRLPESDDVGLAARYLPADRPSMVGGDWYDAFPLRDGVLALAVGDVVGHGVEAAAAMGQMRNALRAYAFAEDSPAAVLDRLNRLAVGLAEGTLATALFGVLDVGTRTFRWAGAGHPAPLLLSDPGPRLLPPPRGMMLGADARATYGEVTEQLAPGDLLVLYSDGLVERRSSDLDADAAALVAAAAGLAGNAPRAVCDALVTRLIPAADPEDDACVLVLGLAAEPAPQRGGTTATNEQLWAEAALPSPGTHGTQLLRADVARPADVTSSRGRLAASLATDPRTARADDVERLLLAYEELASNGLRHGGPPVRTTVDAGPDGWLIVVTDTAVDRRPSPAVDRDPAHGGLGLYLVARLCAAHGWSVEPGRKHVWARITRDRGS